MEDGVWIRSSGTVSGMADEVDQLYQGVSEAMVRPVKRTALLLQVRVCRLGRYCPERILFDYSVQY